MRKKQRAFTGILAAATTVGLMACSPASGGGEETYTLTLAALAGEAHPSSQASIYWMDRVTELTDGKVKFRPTWSSGLLAGDEILAGVGDGRADLGQTSTSYFPEALSYMNLSTVPFLANDGEATARALNDLYHNNEAVKSQFTENGARLITIEPLDVVLLGSKDGYPDLASLDKEQIRAVGAWGEALTAAGAEPVAVPFAELYEALQRGVVDGYGLNWDGIWDAGLQEVAPVMSDPGIGSISQNMLIMSDKKYNSLPEDIQAAIDKATEETVDRLSKISAEVNQEQCELQIEAGAEFSTWPESEREKWRNLVGDRVLDLWKGKQPDSATANAVLDEFKSNLKKYASESEWQSGLAICQQVANEK